MERDPQPMEKLEALTCVIPGTKIPTSGVCYIVGVPGVFFDLERSTLLFALLAELLSRIGDPEVDEIPEVDKLVGRLLARTAHPLREVTRKGTRAFEGEVFPDGIVYYAQAMPDGSAVLKIGYAADPDADDMVQEIIDDLCEPPGGDA